jgi:hypothetical protein
VLSTGETVTAAHDESRRLRNLLNCSCGHTVVKHAATGGCCGATFRNERCVCTLSDAAVLDAGIASFGGARHLPAY